MKDEACHAKLHHRREKMESFVGLTEESSGNCVSSAKNFRSIADWMRKFHKNAEVKISTAISMKFADLESQFMTFWATNLHVASTQVTSDENKYLLIDTPSPGIVTIRYPFN
jgi:hypothetical protein